MPFTAFAQEPLATQPGIGKPLASPGIVTPAAVHPVESIAAPERGHRYLEIDDPRPPVEAGILRPRRRFAVCIGIDHYPPGCGYGPLQFAGKDATAFSECLLARCEFESVLLMTDAKVAGGAVSGVYA
jgi:hypothetical protein